MDIRGDDYRTSIDRIGLAFAAGAVLAGLAAAVLVVLGGDGSAHAILFALVLGALFASVAIAAVGGPVWLALHAAGRRGPVAAAATGTILGFALTLAAELGRGGADSWPRALGAALLAAALAGGIALAMWRVAYRDIGG